MKTAAFDVRSSGSKGMFGSVLIHAVLAIIFFLWSVTAPTTKQEFIEVTWDNLPTPKTVSTKRFTIAKRARPTGAPPREKPSSRVSKITETARTVDLPERRFDPPDQSLSIPQTKKLDVADQSVAQKKIPTDDYAVAAKDRGGANSSGRQEKTAVPGRGGTGNDVVKPGGGSKAGEASDAILDWGDGGTRKKISGELPLYPPGVHVEAQIKIETVVAPDGSVKRCKPAQKGNRKLEEAAMDKVRLWMFEELRSSSTQKDQICVITFNFTLK